MLFSILLTSYIKVFIVHWSYNSSVESLRSWIRATTPNQYWKFSYLILMGKEIRSFFGFIYIHMCVFILMYKNKITLRIEVSSSKWAFPYFEQNYGSFHIIVYLNLSSACFLAVVSLFYFCLFSSFSKAAFRNGVEKRHITSWSC